MPQLETIKDTLKMLDLIYDRRLTEQAIETLAVVLQQDCATLSDADFLQAVAMHRKTSSYFPRPACILKAFELVKAARPTKEYTAPHGDMTEAEALEAWERNKHLFDGFQSKRVQ